MENILNVAIFTSYTKSQRENLEKILTNGNFIFDKIKWYYKKYYLVYNITENYAKKLMPKFYFFNIISEQSFNKFECSEKIIEKIMLANKKYNKAAEYLPTVNEILKESINEKYTEKHHWLNRIKVKNAIDVVLDNSSIFNLLKNTYISCFGVLLSNDKDKLIKKIQDSNYSYIKLVGNAFIILPFRKNYEANKIDVVSDSSKLKDFIRNESNFMYNSLYVDEEFRMHFFDKDRNEELSERNIKTIEEAVKILFEKNNLFINVKTDSKVGTINGLRSRRFHGEICVI